MGVRELRQRASELLRLVELGHTVRITDSSRPVAARTDDAWPQPLALDADTSASQALAELRRDER